MHEVGGMLVYILANDDPDSLVQSEVAPAPSGADSASIPVKC
jgi:hypothetical protein